MKAVIRVPPAGRVTAHDSPSYIYSVPGAAHVPFEMFQQAADIMLLHVPYRGGGPALTAFLGKQVDITAQAPGPITPHVQGGAARLLALTRFFASPIKWHFQGFQLSGNMLALGSKSGGAA
jgi:tripartite tricarboxylate transporter family receptor